MQTEAERMKELKIVHKRLDELKPYDNNPRINDNAVDAVVKSINEVGFRVPLIITADSVIITGHTRYKAAEKLKLNKIPCIIADDLTDEQVRIFRIIDNKTSELSEWDFEKLKQELYELDFDFEAFGFDNLLEEIKEELQNTSQELSVDDYSDDEFECTCPRCGFKFNR